MDVKLNNYKKISMMGYAVHLPDNIIFREEIIKTMRAAVLSGMMGVKFNTALKCIEDSPDPEDPKEYKLIYESKEYCNSIIYILNNKLKNIQPSDNLRAELIRNAFARLESSFESAIFLSFEGFNFEPKLLFRLIFENLNFIYQVCNVKENKFDNIIDFCKNHKIINTNFNKLKKFYTRIDIGKMYGMLSNYSHFDPSIQNTMFTWGLDKVRVYVKSYKYAYENFLILIALLELTQDIAELAFELNFQLEDVLQTEEKSGLKYKKANTLLGLVEEQLHTIKNTSYNLREILIPNPKDL